MSGYPEYKRGSVEWIGEIPSHWDSLSIKRVAEVVNGATPKSGQAEYWGGDVVWITPADLGKLDGAVVDRSDRTLTAEGLRSCGASMTPAESVVLSTRAPIGHVALTSTPSCTNQGCKTLVPDLQLSDPKHLFYTVLAGKAFLRALGQGSTFTELPTHALADMSIPLPPLAEQRQLAAYLDRKTADVDTLIGQKQALIARLGELRAALIHRAVTKGLDADVPMKDSGVEWLGEVPEHWAAVQVRYAAGNCDNRRIPLSGSERGDRSGPYPYYGANGVIDHIDDFIFEGTYVLIGEDGAPFFDPLQDVARVATGKYWVNNHAHILNPYDTFSAQYLAHALNRVDYAGYISGSTRDKLTQSDLSSIVVPRPPREEQDMIAAYLTRKLEDVESVREREAALIVCLRELRTSLISEVVTGKVDVRAEPLAESAPAVDAAA